VTIFTPNPDLALTLVTVGVLLVCAEFLRPGKVLPGVAGSVAILIGITGFSRPVPGGAILVVLALALLLGAATRSRWQSMRFAAVPLMPAGIIWMNPQIQLTTAIVTMVPLSLVLSFLSSTAARARRNKGFSC